MPGAPRILVTRSPRQSSALADRLRELGAEPVLIPTIEIVDPESFTALDQALAELPSFDWLLFTSANAVDALHARLTYLNLTLHSSHSVISTKAPCSLLVSSTEARSAERRNPCISPGKSRSDEPESRPRVAAIGPATARALQDFGVTPDLLPPEAVAESFAQALLPYALHDDGSPAKFLLIRAEEAREHLPESLRAAGAEVTIAPAYRTVVPTVFIPRFRELFSPANEGARVDAVTFTSASTVRNLFTMLDAARTTLPPEVIRGSIGPVTSAALADVGFPANLQAEQTTIDSLAIDLVKYLSASQMR